MRYEKPQVQRTRVIATMQVKPSPCDEPDGIPTT